MSVKLFNVNWPADLRDKVISEITSQGGKVRTAKHKDKASGFYFYLLDITELQLGYVMDIVQSSFTEYFGENDLDKNYGFTVNERDMIAVGCGLLKYRKAFRNITLSRATFEKLLANVEFMRTIQGSYFEYDNCYDFYVKEGQETYFLDMLREEIDVCVLNNVQSLPVTYDYNTEVYAYTDTPKEKKHDVVRNYQMSISDLQPAFIPYIKKMLLWYARTGTCETSFTAGSHVFSYLHFTATQEQMLKAMTCAYAVFLSDTDYTGEMTTTINAEVYTFSYERKDIIKVIALKDIVDSALLLDKISKHLTELDIFNYYCKGVWYIEAKHYRTFINYGDRLLKKYPDAVFQWHH